MANPIDPGPLDWRISIVDKEGRPSPEFQRRWNTNRGNTALIGGSITFGSGAPSGTPDDGAEYVDITTTPYTFYVGYGGTWHLLSPTAGANPTATAGDTAVNGTALTFMRSDAAPAVRKGSASQFGIVKVDGTTITATGGIITSIAGAGGQSWLPLASGDDAGSLITDGAGNLVTVPYQGFDPMVPKTIAGVMALPFLAQAGVFSHVKSMVGAQTLPFLTQAGVMSRSSARTGTIAMTLPFLTQVASMTRSTPVTYSYLNPDGSGNRFTTVSYEGNDSWAGGGPYVALDGTFSNAGWLNSGQTGYIAWDFHRARVIKEITWTQSGASSQGTYTVDGSNDFSSWTTIVSGVGLGGTNPTVVSMSSNTTGYRFYRFNRTAGSTTNGPYVQEVEFKIDDNVIAAGYYTALGSGDRRATIVATGTIGMYGTQDPEDLIRGDRTNRTGIGTGRPAGEYFQWDFGSAIIIKDAVLIQSVAAANGTWQWSGSNTAGSGYVNIGSPQAISSTFEDTVFDQLASNTTAYRYYRMTLDSGTTSNGPYLHDFNFSVQ